MALSDMPFNYSQRRIIRKLGIKPSPLKTNLSTGNIPDFLNALVLLYGVITIRKFDPTKSTFS